MAWKNNFIIEILIIIVGFCLLVFLGLSAIATRMTPFECNIIALLALISPIVWIFTKDKNERSIFGFLMIYGISFSITLFIFWLIKIVF